MSRKKLPVEFFKIMYINYKLRGMCSKEANDREICGECNPKYSLIEYDSSLSDDELACTLLHEALHGYVYTMGIDFESSKDEEKFVTLFGNAMTTFFKDNPKFLEWLYDLYCNDKE